MAKKKELSKGQQRTNADPANCDGCDRRPSSTGYGPIIDCSVTYLRSILSVVQWTASDRSHSISHPYHPLIDLLKKKMEGVFQIESIQL